MTRAEIIDGLSVTEDDIDKSLLFLPRMNLVPEVGNGYVAVDTSEEPLT